MPTKRSPSSIRLRLPEGSGCWLDKGPEIWETLQPHQGQQTGHLDAPLGVFVLGFVTTLFDTPLGGLAFFAPQVDGGTASSHPQVSLAGYQ